MRRNSAKPFTLSQGDRSIIQRAYETRDIRYLTSWYFDWEPYSRQAAWLQRFGMGGLAGTAGRESILTAGTRWGKSESMGVELLLGAMLNPGSRQCNVSITLDQAAIVFDVADRMAAHPRFNHWVRDVVRTPFPVIRLANGSEIWARSTQRDCKYLRGHKFHRVNYDECAWGKEKDLNVILTRLADYNGDLSGTTTPKGRNWVFRWWQRLFGKAQTRRAQAYIQQGSSYDNPHISHSFLDGLKERLTERAIQQEILAKFLTLEDGVFRWQDIQTCFDPDLNEQYEFDNRNQRFWTPPVPGHQHWSSWDLARKTTWTVGTTFDVSESPPLLVAYERFQHRPWPAVAAAIEQRSRDYPGQTVVDSTGPGDPLYGFLQVPADGFIFSNRSKYDALVDLQWLIENHGIRGPWIRHIVDELSLYTWDEELDDEEHEEGERPTWDVVMSLAMAASKMRIGIGYMPMALAGREREA